MNDRFSPTRGGRKRGFGQARRSNKNDSEKARQQRRAATLKYIEEYRKRQAKAWEDVNSKGICCLNKTFAKADIRQLSLHETPLMSDEGTNNGDDGDSGWANPILNENSNQFDAGPDVLVEKTRPILPADRSAKSKHEWVARWIKDPMQMLTSHSLFVRTVEAVREEWRAAQQARLVQEDAYHAVRAHFLEHVAMLQQEEEMLDKIGEALQMSCLHGSDLTSTRGLKKNFPMKEILEVLSAQLDEVQSLEQDNVYLLERLRAHQALSKAKWHTSGEDIDEDVTEFDCFFDMEVNQPAWTPFGRGIIQEMRPDDEVVEVLLPYGTAFMQPRDVLPAGGVRPKNLPKDVDLVKAWDSISTTWDPALMPQTEEEILECYENVLGYDVIQGFFKSRYEDLSPQVFTHMEDDYEIAETSESESVAKKRKELKDQDFPRKRILPVGRVLDYEGICRNKTEGIIWNEEKLPLCAAEEDDNTEDIARMSEELEELRAKAADQQQHKAKQLMKLELLNEEITDMVEKLSRRFAPGSKMFHQQPYSPDPYDFASDSNASDFGHESETFQKPKHISSHRRGRGFGHSHKARRSVGNY